MRPEGGIDPVMYRMLHTELSLDAALDLLEIETVQRSWHAASKFNDEAISKIIEKRREGSK